MNDLKVGVIGLGLGRKFVAACDRSGLVGRLAVCDPDLDRRRQSLGEAQSVAADYSEIGQLLESEKPDVVCVVTPDHLHRPHVEMCLQAGCHVLMTKPLATTLEDGRAIITLAERNGRKVMVAHERRFRSRFRAIKELLEEGRLGEIIFVQANQVSDRRGQFDRAPWYSSPEAGRTAIVGSGIHEVDLIRFLVAQPILTVSASSNRLGNLQFPKSKTTATVLQFKGGAIGQTMISYEVLWPEGAQAPHHFLLAATRGVVHGTHYRTEETARWIDLPRDQSEIQTGCAGCVDAFLASVVYDSPVPVSARDAYGTLAACIAADQSAATGQTRIPDPQDF
jgi:predicted dehydrogenase